MSVDRRPRKPLVAKRDIQVDGSLVRRGQPVPRELSTRGKETLVKHGYAQDHKNDTVNY